MVMAASVRTLPGFYRVTFPGGQHRPACNRRLSRSQTAPHSAHSAGALSHPLGHAPSAAPAAEPPATPDALPSSLADALSQGIALEFEPRYHGLRDVLEMAGTLEADIGLKIRWGPASTQVPLPSPSEAAAALTSLDGAMVNSSLSSFSPLHSYSALPMLLPPSAVEGQSSVDSAGLPAQQPVAVPQYHVADALEVKELEKHEARELPLRGAGWHEYAVRFRTRSLVRFQPSCLQSFPYDLHKLRVIVKVPTRVGKDDVVQIAACPESDAPPRCPDLGLNDWLVLRQRCYMRTIQSGQAWFMRSNAPPETLPDPGPPEPAAIEAAKRMFGVAETNAGSGSNGVKPAKRRRVPQRARKAPELEYVLEFLLQRRARFWVTTVNLPLLVMELFVPMTFAIPLKEVAMRLGLFVTLLLSPVVFKLAMADRIPPLGCLTTLDIQFIFFYVWMLVCAFIQVAAYHLTVKGMNLAASRVDAAGLHVCVVMLLAFHAQHCFVHILPYLKRIRMFEGRSFVCPPIIKVMDVWQRNSTQQAAAA